MVASDRISIFDFVLDTTIPDKGEILTRMSLWWFDQLADLVPNHVLSTEVPAAVRGRVRPILMSVLTSLAGLLPLVLFPGSGSELYRGVGAIVLGGLALSTVLSLFLVPAVFTALWRVRRAVGRLFARR